MKNKTAFLKEENLLTLLSQNNFIVPEIQREYVWGNNEKVIRSFFRELKNKIGDGCNECHQPHSHDKINIGFLYSYKPDYVQLKQERFLDENLIDGQQRFTTLFLLLFYCSIREDRKRDFLSLIRFKEQLSMSFDFKVRDLTRRFLLEFVEKVNSISEIEDIEKQTWYLADYRNDVSIKAMIKALEYIQEDFNLETKYYQHILSNVVFWHFKTEATSQGEELYITMNARGEDLADNEITKAALMLEGQELLESGQKWEAWQQFFWKHRDKMSASQSADNGFNSFLECIAGFEYYRNTQLGFQVEKDVQSLLDIEKVELYFEALKYFEDNKNEFISDYPEYNAWVKTALDQIWQLFNGREVDWFADYTDENKGTERSRMVFVWSVLFFIITCREEDKLSITETFRFLRLHFMKLNNYDRSVTSILENVRTALIHGPWHLHGTKEENKKHQYIKRFVDEEQKDIEQLIWEIEDRKLNQNGRDMAAVNISHLVNFDDTPLLDDLIEVRESFDNLFPENGIKGSAILKSILLFKGKFWRDTSPGYYERYNFSDWRRHIRSAEFADFLIDYKEHNYSLEDVFESYKESFIKEHKDEINNATITLPDLELRTRLCYYTILIEPEIFWSNGENIAIHFEVEEGETRLFEKELMKIWNSKGNFKGYSGNTDLWLVATKEQNSPLEFLKTLTE